MNKLLRILLPAAVLLTAAGCAKETTQSTGEKSREYIRQWIERNYPGLESDQWGVYILEDQEGTGDLWDKEKTYSNIASTVRTIDGKVSTNTIEQMAKQLGTYAWGNYYGPVYYSTGQGSGYAGVEYLLTGMKIGGTRTALIPSWLVTADRYDSMQQYINACGSSVHLLYTVTLEGQCKDILQMEKDSLRAYVTRHYGADQKSSHFQADMTDSLFYFVSDTTAFKGWDQRDDNATLKLNYTGRLLNGQVFDTNVKQSALDAGIYSPSKTYEPVEVVMSSAYSSITMGGSSSLITGFQGALYKMHWAGQKATALFVSNLGYAASGGQDAAGTSYVIPPYSPLLFELELLEE